VKITHTLALWVAAVLLTQSANAQGVARPASSATPNGVAIVDMTYVFEHYDGFQSRKLALQRDIERAEQQLKVMQDEMKGLVERLKDYKAGTDDYKQIELELAKRNANGNVLMQTQKKDFLEREAKMFYTIYQEVSEEIKTFSERNGINLVLRFTGDPVDVDDPQQVVKELNKGVVYYSPSIDITPNILEQLKRRQPRTTAQQPPAGPTATRPVTRAPVPRAQ
jgi:outer membrane protein